MRLPLPLLLTLALAACGSFPRAVGPASDAPEPQRPRVVAFQDAESYRVALQVWQTPEDLAAWIGARFDYDRSRALLLSETQRARSGQMAIRSPQEFFASPSGVCVDLARFAVETLRSIAPDQKANYVMIEFAPVKIAGHTFRLHWLASFERDGRLYFFADSKRPGHIAGPYATTRQFIDEYAEYRGRPVVAFRELGSYQRTRRALAAKQGREARP